MEERRVTVKNLSGDIKTLQEKSTLVRGENGHHKLIGEGQKSLRHQKLNVTKGGVVESIGVVVTFKVRHQ